MIQINQGQLGGPLGAFGKRVFWRDGENFRTARAQAGVAPLLRNDLESMSGVIDPFGSLWTAPKPNSGHSGADFDLS